MDCGDDSMKDMKYVLISTENNCVFTYTPLPTMASAIQQGESDTFIIGITKANCPDYDNFKDRDYFYDRIMYFDIMRTYKFIETSPDDVSDKWKQRREIIRLRQELFYLWDTHAHNSLARNTQYAWPHFTVVAEAELAKCNPAENDFTWIIEEYARIMEVDTKTAYKELKLQIESDNIRNFRVQILAEKWKKEINACTDSTMIAETRRKMIREFWQNSYI